MMNGKTESAQTVSADMKLRIGTQQIKLRLIVPVEEVPPDTLVPTLQQLTTTIIDGVEENARDHGYKVSCKKGCGACCRQHVPISRAEARMLAALVEDMPEPKRSEVKARFEAAVRRLQASGLFDDSVNFHRMNAKQRVKLVRRYFKLGIACPFLEDESCSIHPDRPLICREYLVVSHPRHCAKLDGNKIERLKIPVSVSSTFSKLEGTYPPDENPYLPLILALAWAEKNPQAREKRPGPAWIQQFFQALSGAKIPDPEGPDAMLS